MWAEKAMILCGALEGFTLVTLIVAVVVAIVRDRRHKK